MRTNTRLERRCVPLLAAVLGTTAILGVAAPDPTPSPAPAPQMTPAFATAATATPAVAIPAGTHLRFRVDEALSSNGSKTGQVFGFVLLDPIQVDGRTVAPSGAAGNGTVFLAGHAGNQGHEGDLTLRLDTLNAAADAGVTFADQRLRINGRNRKVASTVLGFVPYVGLAAMFIRGNDIRVDPGTPVETVLLRPALYGPQPSASPSPSVAPSSPGTGPSSPGTGPSSPGTAVPSPGTALPSPVATPT